MREDPVDEGGFSGWGRVQWIWVCVCVCVWGGGGFTGHPACQMVVIRHGVTLHAEAETSVDTHQSWSRSDDPTTSLIVRQKLNTVINKLHESTSEERMYLVFTRMPCEIYRRRFRSLLWRFFDVFRALINSLWLLIYTSTLNRPHSVSIYCNKRDFVMQTIDHQFFSDPAAAFNDNPPPPPPPNSLSHSGGSVWEADFIQWGRVEAQRPA